MALIDTSKDLLKPIYDRLEWLSPLADLGIRWWVAWVFWKSGQAKLANWDSTIFLFEEEYAVPLLSPELAAYLATAAEVVLPILLFIGLATRPAVFALFIFNIIAVISYPGLNAFGVQQHQLWGLMMLVTLFHGPGKLSVDYLLRRRFWD